MADRGEGTAQRSEVPPSLVFDLGWAKGADEEFIRSRMKVLHRQTMNLRTGVDARLLMLKNEAGVIIAWAGLETGGGRDRPEFFSLHVEEAYRTYLLGLILEVARGLLLQKAGIHKAYLRMDSETNSSLYRYKLSTGVFRQLADAEVDASFVGRCSNCELYKTECRTQVWIEVDVDALVARGKARLGDFSVDVLPRRFELRPEMFRQERRPVQTDPHKPYRPHWT